MRLKKIKLSGFKSFVDPTTIPLSANLIGIVGPNGCGKSNVIDAVRWVMGESSASRLRGDSMADVIFSGSTARKPVGKASVELIFDNSDGSAPGQYASYAEISIRREASRDGQSDYFINKTRCRRKDIMDIFLGTGLGPRTYSIIEQGMVTRIIEAKPEDLRGFFEEAAGISKYKERRRETETRIKHARENLARVEDIRKELETQLNRLQRQSKAAQKYKEWKQQERRLRAELLALRARALQESIQQHDVELAAREKELEAAIAVQRAIEADIESLRGRQIEASDRFNEVQARFYALGGEISHLEQTIQHARETRAQRRREQAQLERAWDEANGHLQTDRRRCDELREKLAAAAPTLDELRNKRGAAADDLARADADMQAQQAAWERLTLEAAEPVKTRDVQSQRIRQLEQQLQQLQARRARLDEESVRIGGQIVPRLAQELRDEVAAREQGCEAREREVERLEAQLKELQSQTVQAHRDLEQARSRRHQLQARQASLEELQAAALGKYDEALNGWLAQKGLTAAPRLAGLIKVENGWERAVERVLGGDLGAVCIEHLDTVAAELAALGQSEVVVFDTATSPAAASGGARPSLRDKVQGQADLTSLLSGVYIADDLAAALALRPNLAPHESVVTRAGEWLGRNWVVLGSEQGARAGLLARARELDNIKDELSQADGEVAALETAQAARATQQAELEKQREAVRRALSEDQRERANLRAKLAHEEAQQTQLNARHTQIVAECGDIDANTAQLRADFEAARRLLSQAEAAVTAHEVQRAALTTARDAARAALTEARSHAQAAADALHRAELERGAAQTALASTEQGLARLESQLQDLLARRADIDEWFQNEQDPEAELKTKLESLLAQRLEVETTLQAARQAMAEAEGALRERERTRGEQEEQVDQARARVGQYQMARQEFVVRAQALAEQLGESGFDQATVLAEMPQDASEATHQEALDDLAKKIERLGPINLAAIQEFEEQSQRKGFLDRQHEDLAQALGTLEDAIRKMDRETRTLFRETFDKVNTSFQAFFPRLFGGGHAYLELVGEDLLDSGVTVMARPPGKRNSTIHLLSGGEKALTAVALIFAIFELNPAPFCLLDEVDAPLDDANVERYANALKTLSQRSQLCYITHNKISMEMADVLLGVTMSEPGVSRLVAVDVEEAMEMVAQAEAAGT